jgi:hypothetical protein
MNQGFWKREWLVALAGVVLLAVASCGDDDGTELASELFGTWDLVSIQASGMTANCPGEIQLGGDDSVSCGTEATTFNSDGTFVEVETTDEFGNEINFRSEGTWLTQGSTLTITYLREGPDENSLQPLNPPETESVTWSVAGGTLTISITSPLPPFIEISATLQKL